MIRGSERMPAIIAVLTLASAGPVGVVIDYVLASHYMLGAVVLVIGLPLTATTLLVAVGLAVGAWRVESVATARVLLGIGAGLAGLTALLVAAVCAGQWNENRLGTGNADRPPEQGPVVGGILAFGFLAFVLVVIIWAVVAIRSTGRRDVKAG